MTKSRTFQRAATLPEGAQPIDRAALRDQSDELRQTQAPAPEKVPAPQPQQMEFKAPVAQAEMILPDGRKVLLAPPRLAISTRVAGMMRNFKSDNALIYGEEKMNCRALLYVRAIDGQTVAPPHDDISRDALEQELGIDGFDMLLDAWLTNFPPLALQTIQGDVKK